MSLNTQDLARILKSGNADSLVQAPSGYFLPERGELDNRVNDYITRIRRIAPSDADLLNGSIQSILGELYDGRPANSPIPDFATESVVIVDGSRPVFFFENGKLTPGVGTGPFVERLKARAPFVESVGASVGRIESDLKISEDWMGGVFFLGTAFMVGPHLAMTNRHVAQEMLRGDGIGSGPFKLNGPWWLNFTGEDGSITRKRFAISEVAWCAPDPIMPGSGLDKLDMAILRLGEAEFSGDVEPAPLVLSLADVAQGQVVGIVGYPGKPRVILNSSGGSLKCDEEEDRVLVRLFDNRFGFKRCGSGEIDSQPGFIGDTNSWTITHDISTLGGNSGSPVFDLSGSDHVLALHFGGCSRKENYGAVFGHLASTLSGLGISVA